jgi:hypothetical protein
MNGGNNQTSTRVAFLLSLSSLGASQRSITNMVKSNNVLVSLEVFCTPSMFLRRTLHHTPRRPDVVAPLCDLLISAHSQSGMPWIAVIGGTSVLARTVLTLPLAVYQQHIAARLELLKPEMKDWAEALKYRTAVKARRDGKSPEEAERLFKTDVCHILLGSSLTSFR